MNNQNFSTTIVVEKSAMEVFDAICNVRAWWSGEFEGSADHLGDEFTYRYQDIHMSKQKVTEFIPGKRIVWHVREASINFTKVKDEWKGTDIVFDLSENNGKTEIQFTHVGLVPTFECYSACSQGWGSLIQENLKKLITSGGNQPDVFA